MVVQNRWASEAVLQALDDEQLKTRLGRFTLADCERLWSSSEYQDMHLQLLALMEKFELCYKLDDARPETWLVPQLLSPSVPPALQAWDSAEDLALRYRYEFLPRGWVSRLMVRMHRFVARPDHCWSSGVLFERHEAQLLVRADDGEDAITMRARGPERKELLNVIASAVDALNESFEGLRGKVQRLVPCVCERCRRQVNPELFEQDRLIERRSAGKLTIECTRPPYANVSVLELLDELWLHAMPSWAGEQVAPPVPASSEARDRAGAEPVRPLRTIKIFLASSAELHADRDAFDLHFRQMNDFSVKDGVYLQVVRWENFLDAMSDTRLQDEYNREVRDADIFVSLFMTKTGRYTEEEFDVAHKVFKEQGRPLVYTFFKQTPMAPTRDNLAALASLVAFQEKLEKLGHFTKEYNDAAHLNLLFRQQLEILKARDWFRLQGSNSDAGSRAR